MQQSPVDLFRFDADMRKEPDNPTKLTYATNPYQMGHPNVAPIIDNGIFKIVPNKGRFYMATTNNKVLSEDEYNFWYMEFKSPSEHSIKGKKYEFEI